VVGVVGVAAGGGAADQPEDEQGDEEQGDEDDEAEAEGEHQAQPRPPSRARRLGGRRQELASDLQVILGWGWRHEASGRGDSQRGGEEERM
jgi:hypothetical protein